MVTAITGGIAEGKSTILDFLSGLGYRTLSADSVARDLFNEPSVNRLLAEVAELPLPLTPRELQQAIAARPQIRRFVNRIIHPRVLERLGDDKAEFVEVPLLIETCLQSRFDQVWVATCGLDEQRRRLIARYGLSFDWNAMMASQLPTVAKFPFADEVFRTNCPVETVRQNVSEALARRFECG